MSKLKYVGIYEYYGFFLKGNFSFRCRREVYLPNKPNLKCSNYQNLGDRAAVWILDPVEMAWECIMVKSIQKLGLLVIV